MKNILEQWNGAAQKYTEDQETSIYSESNKETVKNRFKNLTGLKVLDLGCGYGFYTDYFQSLGPHVIGVDGSKNMLEIAQKRYPQCTFEQWDISKKFPFENESFDLVFCNQVLMDIEDIETVFSECYRVLKQNGIFYYSIVHPAFYDSVWLENENGFKYAKAISSYIEPYSFLNKFWGETKHFHRSLTYYLNTAANHGFYLRHVDEPVSYDGITKKQRFTFIFLCRISEKIN